MSQQCIAMIDATAAKADKALQRNRGSPGDHGISSLNPRPLNVESSLPETPMHQGHAGRGGNDHGVIVNTEGSWTAARIMVGAGEKSHCPVNCSCTRDRHICLYGI